MDQWGLNWVKLPAGTYTLAFSGVPGYESPPTQTVTVTAGSTTTANGTFTPDGYLQVNLAPAGIDGTISIDGKPADDFGSWSYLTPGPHQVCYGAVANFTAPACVTPTVTAATTTQVTGTYTSTPGTAGPSNFGLLRVTSSPALPTRISLTTSGNQGGSPVPMDQWGLQWVRLSPGTYTVSFSDVPGYEAPPPRASPSWPAPPLSSTARSPRTASSESS